MAETCRSRTTMDSHNSAQDVHRCDLCETIVDSYCDFCHANLCKPCIGEHISDGYEKHKIVPFQQRRSTLIYPKCKVHPLKNCKFQCKDCEHFFVCSSCMASEQHRGHIFMDVTEVYKEKKKFIESDVEDFKNHQYLYRENIVFDIEKKLANLDKEYENLTSQISQNGQEWHKAVSKVVYTMKTEIKEIKEKHRDQLQKGLDIAKKQRDMVKEYLLFLMDFKESNDVSLAFNYRSDHGNYSEYWPGELLTLTTFKPNPVDSLKLYRLVGCIIPSIYD